KDTSISRHKYRRSRSKERSKSRSPSKDQFGRVAKKRHSTSVERERSSRYRRSRERSSRRSRSRSGSRSRSRSGSRSRSRSREKSSRKRSRSSKEHEDSHRRRPSPPPRRGAVVDTELARKKRELEELNEMIAYKKSLVDPRGLEPGGRTCIDYDHGRISMPRSILKKRPEEPDYIRPPYDDPYYDRPYGPFPGRCYGEPYSDPYPHPYADRPYADRPYDSRLYGDPPYGGAPSSSHRYTDRYDVYNEHYDSHFYDPAYRERPYDPYPPVKRSRSPEPRVSSPPSQDANISAKSLTHSVSTFRPPSPIDSPPKTPSPKRKFTTPPQSPPAQKPPLHRFLDMLNKKTVAEKTSEPLDVTDDLLPHERALQDGKGFSSIVGMAQERPSSSLVHEVEIKQPNSKQPSVEKMGDGQNPEPYDKIQSLLRSIGLKLSSGEVSKLASKAQEKTLSFKSSSMERETFPKEELRSGRTGSVEMDHIHSPSPARSSSIEPSSSSRSRSRSHGRGTKRGASWSSEDHESKKTTAAKTSKDWEVKETKNEWSTPTLPQSQTSDPAPIPTHTGMHIPTYPPPQLPGMMPPNYPPSAYSQYGNYLPYIHQQWPPMYPPPNMALPPQPAIENLTPPPTYKKAYRKPTPDTGPLGEEPSLRSAVIGHSDLQVIQLDWFRKRPEPVREAGVLEEREKLRQEREVRMTKKEYLIKELERLRKQQGELLRKKRREKDGHKDPLLQEINRLQDEVMAKISNLRKEHEAAERKRSEIEKVAQILGLSPLDRPGKISKLNKIRDQEELPPKSEKREQGRNPEEQPCENSVNLIKLSKMITHFCVLPTSTEASPERQLSTAEAPPPDPFEYYDAGNHWCKNCNITSGSMFDFFTHLHSKPHRKTLDPYNRPWASGPTKTPKTTSGDAKQTKPAKGSEFLVPVRGFFCLLCKEFYGDAICAEEHVITHFHNEKYKKQMLENPLYEQRRNLDRQAGLGLEAGGKKRKYDDDDKDRDEKSKNKKEKKKEEEAAETCDEKIKVKQEEEEQKVKATRKSLEEDKLYSKKDEDEKYKHSKKEEKHNSRENEDRNSRYRGSTRDEEYRHRHRRDDDGHPKYGNKYTEDKYKQEKCSDSRSKHDRDEGKQKAEPEKPGGKPDVRKSEPPAKPYELPKIFCGPSPAMRAKLRKQAMEANKAPASAGAATSFGKFTWKKKENQLAKEAQKVAAEFLKDEEAAAKQKPGEEEDSLSKSVAAAKEIAEKLAGEELKSPPWYASVRGQIRPNLRAPVAPLRRASLAGKPASLNTFLNMKPQSTDGGPPGPFPRAPFRPPNPQMFNNKPGPPVSSAGPFGAMSAAPMVTGREQFGPKLPPSMLKPEPCQNTSKPDSAESKPEMKQGPLFPKPALVQSKPATAQSSPSTTSPASLNTASSETLSAPSEVKAAPPKVPPSQPALIKIVSDVAAPGVPESEQTRTVFVKPPPFKSMLAGPQKSEKLQGNLAAAKAQALFDIFYSSLGQAGPSSFSKTETDVRAAKSSPSVPVQNKNRPQNKPEPQKQTQTPNTLPTQTHNQSQPPDGPRLQTQEMPESQPQIEPQLQNEPKPLKHTQPQPQDEPTPQPQVQSPKVHHAQSPNEPQPRQQAQQKPGSQPPDHSLHQAEPSHEPQTAPQHRSTEPPNTTPTSPQNGFQSPQTQTDGDIQITSVWSLQDITAPTAKAAGPDPSDPPPHSEQTPPEGLSQSPPSSPGPKSQICPQTKPVRMEPAAEPLFQPEPQFEPQLDQDANSHQETTSEPQPKPKPSPRTRGKAATTKKTPSAAPVRQTRSQTRYQTRQQQSQPELEQDPGNQDITASEAKGLESPDPDKETDPPGTAVTPETLGLPSDMTALDFDYTFNFE
uniref:U1-type domain-containing protein n=1 Tax=Xiphophorus couchianus TaxID=32473 RepID=A0A3B5L6U6_9TELE